MEKMLEMILMVAVCVASALANNLLVDDDVLVVNVERFKGDSPPCHPRQVCADVFNFTRDHGDGTGRRESRFIENCMCPNGADCGRTGTQLMFKETKTQAMTTCEDASLFRVCEDGEIAKEQHNLGKSVIYQVNCLCPNNDFPGNFYNKMTIRKSFQDMDYEEQAKMQAHPRSRFFRCRREDEYRPSIFN